MNEEQIRANERQRLSRLLHDNAETIADFAKDAESAIRVVALMLDLVPTGIDGAEYLPQQVTFADKISADVDSVMFMLDTGGSAEFRKVEPDEGPPFL